MCEFTGSSMKALFLIGLMLALSANLSVSAQAEKSKEVAHAIKQADLKTVEISAYENHIRVENAPVGSKLEIYSVVGIKVKEIEMKQPSGEYVVNIAKGYYIIRIGETVRKVAIR